MWYQGEFRTPAGAYGYSGDRKVETQSHLFWAQAALSYARARAAELGIEHEAIEGACDVILFEDLGNGQTKLTFIGNETMQNAIQTGQLEGMKQILDKMADVVAAMAQAK